MPYYFAYGSNMNPERMAGRGLAVVSAASGRLLDMELRFDKRSRHNPGWGCANVAWKPGAVVEGVLYRLADPAQIQLMDPFEGTPRYYSRERYPIHSAGSITHAWVYVANPAVVDNSVLPLRRYLNHLLAGRRYLSDDYYRFLQQVQCHQDDEEVWG